MSNILPKRIVVYPKDVERITGRKDKTARKLLKDIRFHFGKTTKDFISVREFSQFTGLKEEDIYPFLV